MVSSLRKGKVEHNKHWETMHIPSSFSFPESTSISSDLIDSTDMFDDIESSSVGNDLSFPEIARTT